MQTVETPVLLFQHPSEVGTSFELAEQSRMQASNHHLLLAVAVLDLFDEEFELFHRLIVDILHIPKAKHQVRIEVVKRAFLLISFPADYRHDVLVMLMEVQVAYTPSESIQNVVLTGLKWWDIIVDRDYLGVVFVVLAGLDLLKGG